MNHNRARTLEATPFLKTCSNCGKKWENLTLFIEDPNIELLGYMPAFKSITHGLFLFNHDCKTTLACKVELFTDLYDGPLYEDAKTGSDGCPGHCEDIENLEPCSEKCSCAFAREIIQVLKAWPKSFSSER